MSADREPIHQSDPRSRPDGEFEPGTLAHLVPGNRGRLLDARRTPIAVVGLRPETGEFDLEILAFEDKGARWRIPFEGVAVYQFEKGAVRADAAAVAALEEAVRRFDRPLEIRCDPAAREHTEARIAAERDQAEKWLRRHSRFLSAGGTLPDPERRRGDPFLIHDLAAYLAERDLGGLDEAFADRFVTNPGSGDLVKAHEIVMAELGLVPYRGKVMRDPAMLEGEWSRPARERHVVTRLAFVRAVYGLAGIDRFVLYRGVSSETPIRPGARGSLVSASFNRRVAESLFDGLGRLAHGLLVRQPVPIERVFLTYLETEAMNRRFLEAEAVLLGDEENPAF